uniref:Uncharacterized protein n=1 Tax=Arundo donax TaxID=35708 RepID=A0A0A9GM32_ARUDO
MPLQHEPHYYQHNPPRQEHAISNINSASIYMLILNLYINIAGIGYTKMMEHRCH